MGYIRNLAVFAVFALIITGCGGGNTIAANDTSGNLSNGSGNTGGTGGNTGGSGAITLQWTAPSSRADNTAASLSEISGYRLYYGSSSTDTPNFVNISNGTTTQYSISLPTGSYYFRISAIDTNGYEGLKSSAIQKTI